LERIDNVNARFSFDVQAIAQQPTGTSSDERSQAFRPVQGGSELQSGEKLLVEAYAAIWVIVFLMVLLSWRRQRQIDRRIDVLETAVERARAGAGRGTS
jgi:CcmD family protein